MNRIAANDMGRPEGRAESTAFLRDQLITCIGNKRALIHEIGDMIDVVRARLGQDRLAFLDLFSGSGIVSRRAKQASHFVIANDLEPYSEVINQCYLANADPRLFGELEDCLETLEYEVSADMDPGFITELYAPKNDRNIVPGERVFYSRRNAIYIDSARRAISRLPGRLQPYFLGPLLSAASVHANTSGVFKGFYKNAVGVGQFGGEGEYALKRILGDIQLRLPVFSNFDGDAMVTRHDANYLVREIEPVDLAYIDPPYNQHPYGSNYFMLNLITTYQRPASVSRVSGIPTDWNRSRYNKPAGVEEALFSLVEDCPASFVLVSYNSEGFVSKDKFLAVLQQMGRLETRELAYNAFRGSRNLRARDRYVTEYLFLLDKR